MFGVFGDLVEHADARDTLEQHATFADRLDSLAGKVLVLNLRRLPAWVLSRAQLVARDGVWPDFEPVPMPSAQVLAESTLPDERLAAFTAGVQVDRWLRMECLADDLLGFVSQLRDVSDAEQRNVRGLGRLNALDYDHATARWFTDRQVATMYERNPAWAALELQLYERVDWSRAVWYQQTLRGTETIDDQEQARAVTRADEMPGENETLPVRPRCARLERFDEHMLDMVGEQVDSVALVLESHIPTLLGWLRAGEDPQALLDELRAAVALCAARKIPFEVEVPFLTETASSLPETVAYLAGAGVVTVRIVPAREISGRERPLDPYACFSERYMDRIRLLCEEAAQAGGAELVWEPRAGASFGLLQLPGFCEDAWGRVHIHADGLVTPCIYAPLGELDLGTLGPDGLDPIWRGRESLDLRRAHLTWDYPGACASCPRCAAVSGERQLPFMDRFAAEVAAGAEAEAAVTAISPGPLARLVRAPTITLARMQQPASSWHFAWSRGGTAEHLQHVELRPSSDGNSAIALPLPADLWGQIEPNVGYWWAVFAELDAGGWAAMGAARCVVSHKALPRLEGSRLRYPGDPRRDPSGPPVLSPAMGDREYEDLVTRVREAVRAVVPQGEIAAVISKGDDRLAQLGDVEGWHFPRSDDGSFAGFHPPDGDWAVAHLRSLRAAGAGYLVVPATAWWWYEEYPQLAAYLRERCELVLEERGTCVVVALDGGERALG